MSQHKRERVKVGPGEVTPKPSTWMNPLNKIKWRKAIMDRATTFELSDGRKFTIDYKRRPGYALVKPVKGFTPMGWFDIDRVKRSDGDWIVDSVVKSR